MQEKKCQICGCENPDNFHFYKFHDIKIANYYQKFYPRYNKLTNELIEFKNTEQYFSQDFKNRIELQKWAKTKSKKEFFDYLVEFLIKRKELKNIEYLPGQFESRTLIFPAISYLITTFGLDSLKQLAEKAGLKIKYKYENLNFNDKVHEIIVDTREQKPLKFLKSFAKVQKLDQGDYKVLNHFQNISIDRKGLNDAIGTLSKNYERFEKEIIRSEKEKEQLIMMIEESFSNLLSFNYLPHTKYSQTNPDFIFHKIRTLLNNHQNFQVVSVDGRVNATEFVEKVFNLQNDIKTVDLQYYIDQQLW